LREAWNAFWFRPSAPNGIIAARVVIALNALWLIASRPLLPDVVRWPAPFWTHADVFIRTRFFVLPLPFFVEMTLYAILAIALVGAAAGIALRVCAFAAAILIYHFAPMEDIFTSIGGPFFRGFTLPLLGLLILAQSQRPKRSDGPSSEFRWPLALMQVLFAFTYLLSGFSKLRIAGASWSTGDTFESIVLAMMIPDSVPPWAHFFVGNALLCWLGAIVGTALDFLFIVAVLSRRAARLIIPITFIAHLVIIRVLGVVFLGMPMLLLFVNWDWVREALRRESGARTEIALAE